MILTRQRLKEILTAIEQSGFIQTGYTVSSKEEKEIEEFWAKSNAASFGEAVRLMHDQIQQAEGVLTGIHFEASGTVRFTIETEDGAYNCFIGGEDLRSLPCLANLGGHRVSFETLEDKVLGLTTCSCQG